MEVVVIVAARSFSVSAPAVAAGIADVFDLHALTTFPGSSPFSSCFSACKSTPAAAAAATSSTSFVSVLAAFTVTNSTAVIDAVVCLRPELLFAEQGEQVALSTITGQVQLEYKVTERAELTLAALKPPLRLLQNNMQIFPW